MLLSSLDKNDHQFKMKIILQKKRTFRESGLLNEKVMALSKIMTYNLSLVEYKIGLIAI